MPKKRRKVAFWRRGKPGPKYDIVLLRPGDRPKGERFETLADARAESERSEQRLRSFSGGNRELEVFAGMPRRLLPVQQAVLSALRASHVAGSLANCSVSPKERTSCASTRCC